MHWPWSEIFKWNHWIIKSYKMNLKHHSGLLKPRLFLWYTTLPYTWLVEYDRNDISKRELSHFMTIHCWLALLLECKLSFSFPLIALREIQVFVNERWSGLHFWYLWKCVEFHMICILQPAKILRQISAPIRKDRICLAFNHLHN